MVNEVLGGDDLLDFLGDSKKNKEKEVTPQQLADLVNQMENGEEGAFSLNIGGVVRKVICTKDEKGEFDMKEAPGRDMGVIGNS